MRRHVFACGSALNLAFRRDADARKKRGGGGGGGGGSLSRKASTNLQARRAVRRRDSRGHTPAAAAAAVVDRRAQDGSLVREGLTTRSKNGGCAIRSVASSSPPPPPSPSHHGRSRGQPLLARSLALCLSVAANTTRRLLSVTLHLILRALHRARHFYAAAMTSVRRRAPCDWTQIDRGRSPQPHMDAAARWFVPGGLWESRRRRELNDRSQKRIYRERASYVSDVSRPYIYRVYENAPRAKESMLVSLHLFESLALPLRSLALEPIYVGSDNSWYL